MTAQEQMKKMLDELMGTQRDENSVVMSTLAQSRGVSFSFHVFLSMRIFLVPRSPMKDFNLSLRQEVF